MSILLVAMSCSTTNEDLAKEKTLEMYPFEKPFSNSQFVYVDGVRLHIRRWSADDSETEKGTVLLVHGISGSSYNWRFLAPELALNGWNVLSIDIPPFGFSGEKQKQGDSLDPLKKDSISRASRMGCIGLYSR